MFLLKSTSVFTKVSNYKLKGLLTKILKKPSKGFGNVPYPES